MTKGQTGHWMQDPTAEEPANVTLIVIIDMELVVCLTRNTAPNTGNNKIPKNQKQVLSLEPVKEICFQDEFHDDRNHERKYYLKG